MIKKFARGYDSTGFKTTVDSFSNTIKSVKLLYIEQIMLIKKKKLVGDYKIVDDLDTVIFGKEYNHVVDINFDLESFCAEWIERRTTILEDNQIQIIARRTSEMTLIEPRKDRVVFEQNNAMDELLEEILSDNTLSTVEKEEESVKNKFKDKKATIIQAEYFKFLI